MKKIAEKFVVVSISLGLASALVSFYWAFGGSVGLASVGGQIEEIARLGGLFAFFIAFGAAMAKLSAVALHWALLQYRHKSYYKYVVGTNWIIATALVLWGGANIVVGSLVLVGIIPADLSPEQLYAMRWHVFFWDLWFLLWGATLAVGLIALRKRSKHHIHAGQTNDQ